MEPQRNAFESLDDYIGLGRVSGLALSPDGTRLVVSLAVLNEKKNAFVSSLWHIDPAGDQLARRITWGAKSETGPEFLPDGSLIFSSARADPDREAGEDPAASLWLLPAGGGEARPLATRPGGIDSVAVATVDGTIVVSSPTMPSSVTAADDEQRRKLRKDLAVTAMLHDSYPVRYWDHDLGPDHNRLLVGTPEFEKVLELKDLTGSVGGALDGEGGFDLSPDGTTIVSAWNVLESGGSARSILVAIDVASGTRRVLLDDPEFEYYGPSISPGGDRVALMTERRSTSERALDQRLVVLDLSDGSSADPVPDWDRWPAGRIVWTPDAGALLVTADDEGRSPIWRIDLNSGGSGEVSRLTTDAAAYSDLRISADGASLYALRSRIDTPAHPVRIDLTSGDVTALLSPVAAPVVPGTVTEIRTAAADGALVRGWLALPHDASAENPAPLLLWIHGGPLGSWNAWQWRWNPWLAVAQGYAVLLPDPALSTGYGLAAIQRSWGRWGVESYTDLMTITDVVAARDDIDAERTAAMGGSYGGYMANWIAGHTDRFRGIVSHAGLWALDQFGPTTDAAYYWRREMTAQMALDNSPNQSVDRIRTPMLVIHGDRDYRVPIGEGLRLWAELAERNTTEDGILPHRFLVFPDENHWILKPQHAKLWYQTVFAFLNHTVHGKPWETPELLR
jgi:dipeptidyl aminopeptidase/acylaminoacyl peptidase